MNLRARRHVFAGAFFMSVFAVLTGAAGRVYSQQAVTYATLAGRVEDSAGALVAGASLTASNLETNQKWSAVTDDAGRYRFAYLPPGRYHLTAGKEGFAAVNKQFTLTVGQAADLTLRLAVAGVAESVDVTGDVGLVETARTQVSETILPREIDAYPLNGRNYLDLALLAPGVSRTNTGSNQRFAETSAVPGTGISVAGQRNLNNGFVVDGVSANDDAAGLAGTFYSQEVIREFQVVTSGGIAEFGRASGGVVNVVTQSGTNAWRGRLYGFFRNRRLDARNPLASSKDALTQSQYGATLGGPLRRDRTFLFTNFEQTRRHDSGVITIRPADVSGINARLDQSGYKGALIQTGEFPGGYDVTNLFARVDHRLSRNNLLTARYSLYDISSPNSRNVGGLNAVSRGSGLANRDQTVNVNDLWTLTSKTVNETRLQVTRSRLTAPVNDATGPAVNISGVASLGTATFSPTARSLDVYEAVDNVTTQRAAHSLKGGVDLLLNRVNITFPGALQGVYTFSSLANFLTGRYVTFQQAFGESDQFQSSPSVGLFAQDEWKPRGNLTVNLGLRYDAQFLPAPVRTDANNFAPRLGLAYAPGDHKTVLRASFGIYFDRIPLRATSNALQRDGSKYSVAVLSFGQTGAPAFPDTLAAFPSGLLASVTTIDPQIKNGYSEQASIQLERALPFDSSLSVGYVHLRGLHLLLSRNVNVPTAPASAGLFNLGRPDARFANVSRYESSGDSYYDGMTVSLNKRAGKWTSLRLSYTLSKAIDDAGNFFFFTPQDNFNLRDDRGLSDNDQRQRLTLSGSLEVPRAKSESAFRHALEGFQLSYIFTYSSRLPFNVQTGTDRNGDTNANDRPAGVGRNTGRGFDFASLDLRLGRKFRLTERASLEAIAEGFNVLNRANLQIPNNVFGTGRTPLQTFGRANAAADPRQLQLGLRLSF
ncbi:MAG TPA: TonB-dependent receptor [Pyrinomonadaceae bacterium]|jgi:hypothetical protein